MPSGLRYLKTPGEFKNILNEGKRRHCPHFLFCCLPKEPAAAYPRLGISIAKINISLAVQRNRIKRLIREAWQKKECEKIRHNMVVIVKKGTETLKNEEIAREIADSFNKFLS